MDLAGKRTDYARDFSHSVDFTSVLVDEDPSLRG